MLCVCFFAHCSDSMRTLCWQCCGCHILVCLAVGRVVTFTTLTMGFYSVGLALGLCAIFIAQRAETTANWKAAAAAGICLGLTVWTTSLALVFVIPSIIWITVRIRSLYVFAIGVVVTAIGAAPWLWGATLHTGFASQRQQGQDGNLASGYWRVLTEPVPAFMGQTLGSTPGQIVTGLFLLAPLAGMILGLPRLNTSMVVLCLSALVISRRDNVGSTHRAFRMALRRVDGARRGWRARVDAESLPNRGRVCGDRRRVVDNQHTLERKPRTRSQAEFRVRNRNPTTGCTTPA